MRALDVSNYIIKYAKAHNMAVDHYRLQCILYFVQCNCLRHLRVQCFDDDMIAVESFGSKVESVYDAYSDFGVADLCNKVKPKDVNIPRYYTMFIDGVIEALNDYKLSSIIAVIKHQTPWKKANARTSSKKIFHKTIMEYYDELVPKEEPKPVEKQEEKPQFLILRLNEKVEN